MKKSKIRQWIEEQISIGKEQGVIRLVGVDTSIWSRGDIEDYMKECKKELKN